MLILADDGASFGTSLSNKDIGTARDDRLVVARIFARHSSVPNLSLNGAMIGGVPATIHTQGRNGSSGASTVSAIMSANVTTGTTATISLSWSASPAEIWAHVISLAQLSSIIPVDAQNDGGNTPLAVTIGQAVGGLVVGVAGGRNGSASDNWSGLTEEFDAMNGGNTYSRTLARVSSVSNSSLSVQVSGAGSRQTLAVASWR
jgi:hypothetical protein